MKLKLLYTGLLIAGTMGTAFSQQVSDEVMLQRIREEGLNKSQVMDIAFHLTDISGPRLSGSPGLKRAQDWAVNTLKTWGMVNAKRESWGKFGKGWEVQKNYAAMTVPYYHAIIAIPRAWTPGTNGLIKGDVVFLKVDTVTDLEKYKGKLKGKIVITQAAALPEQNFTTPEARRDSDNMLARLASATPQAGGGRGGRGGGRPAGAPGVAGAPATAGAPVGRPGGGRGRGGAAGGVSAAVLNKFEVEEGVGLVLAQGSRGSIDGTVFTTNGASYADTAHAVSPTLETSSEDYQRILRLVKAGMPVTMEADIKTEFFAKDLDGYDVVGEIPGTDPKLKAQLVMIGGHLDSWHGATGGTDNAAGSAVMLETMRILSKIGFKPRRTIRIALWSSEEQGEFGSKGYVKNHFADPETMVLKPEHPLLSAYYNLDNGTGKIRGVYAQGNSAIMPIFQSWLEPVKDLGAGTVTINNTGSTDHVAFDAVGLPGFEYIQDPIDYNARTHHSNQDTYDKMIPADLMQAATVNAWFVYKTAQRDEMMPRKELPPPTPPRTRPGAPVTTTATNN